MSMLIDRRSALQLTAGALMFLSAPGLVHGARAGSGLPGVPELQVPLLRYLWGLDTLDTEVMRSAFAPGALVRDADGKLWDKRAGGLEAFLRAQVAGPRGAQHYLQVNRVTAKRGRYRTESYWSRVEWKADEPRPVLTALGSFIDELTEHKGGWLISRREIALWNSGTVTVPVVAEVGG
jgi:hypothetical protein